MAHSIIELHEVKFGSITAWQAVLAYEWEVRYCAGPSKLGMILRRTWPTLKILLIVLDRKDDIIKSSLCSVKRVFWRPQLLPGL